MVLICTLKKAHLFKLEDWRFVDLHNNTCESFLFFQCCSPGACFKTMLLWALISQQTLDLKARPSFGGCLWVPDWRHEWIMWKAFIKSIDLSMCSSFKHEVGSCLWEHAVSCSVISYVHLNSCLNLGCPKLWTHGKICEISFALTTGIYKQQWPYLENLSGWSTSRPPIPPVAEIALRTIQRQVS